MQTNWYKNVHSLNDYTTSYDLEKSSLNSEYDIKHWLANERDIYGQNINWHCYRSNTTKFSRVDDYNMVK